MKHLYLAILLLLAGLSSCTSYKEIVYLQDVPSQYSDSIRNAANITIKSGDWLQILVNSRDEDVTQMLNLNNKSGGNLSGSNQQLGYMVDDNGLIDFPEYGLIKAEGLTLIELSALIKKGLQDKGFAQAPVVTIRFINYSVTVTGEVKNPGTYSSPTGRITILDALSMAGDLTIFGKRYDIKVIREENNVRSIGTIDLRSKRMFNSPYFYLHQNDVVYVEPTKGKAGERDMNQNRIIGTYASVFSAIVSLYLLFK